MQLRGKNLLPKGPDLTSNAPEAPMKTTITAIVTELS